MPTINGIIDDYETMAVRRAKSTAAAIRRAGLQIRADAAKSPPADTRLPVLNYYTPPQPPAGHDTQLAGLRAALHRLVDRITA